MAEEFGFFDPVEIAPDVFDREYNAEEFTDYFGDLVTTGVMKGKGAELKVTANGSNMITEIDTGVAFIEGKRYANTAKFAHTHDTETLGKDRVDRIVVRMDLNERWVKSFVEKGVPSASPVAPVLTQTANLYEISLAQVKVVGGQTYVNVADVVDERGKDVICPWAGSNILPNFDDAALAELMANQLTDGPHAKKFSGDLNNLIRTGFYSCDSSDTTNLPILGSLSGRPWIIEVIVDGNTPGGMQTASQAVLSTSRYFRMRAITGSWMAWEKFSSPYERVNITPLAGWTGTNIHLLKWGDVVTVYGSVKPTSSGAWKAMFMIPSGYRVNYSLSPFPMYGYLSNKTTIAMFMGLMQGGGDVTLEATPVSGVSLTQDMYFAFSYILPRFQ